MSQFILNISNDNDLPDLLFQGSYTVQFIIDERHGVEYVNIDPDTKKEIIENEGIDNIARVDVMQQKELSFYIDADGARFLARLKLMDTFTYTDYRSELITPDEWNVKIDEPNENLDTHYIKVTITIKINFFSKLSSNINFTLVPAVPVTTKPTATGVLITGSNQLGETLTGNYTYVTNGGAEGVSLFRWFRADDSLGTNKQLISGETASTYVVAVADLSKWLVFQVKPVSVSAITDGDYTESPYFNIQNNEVPEAQSVAFVDPTVRVGETAVGTYVYFDANTDAEGNTIQKWYLYKEETGETLVLSGVGENQLPITQAMEDDGYTEFKFGVIPVAVTGLSPGIEVKTSVFGQILPALP